MTTIHLILALLVPWMLGVVWVRGAWSKPMPGAWAAVLGYGFFFGVLLTTLVMLAIDHLGLHLNFKVILSILGALTVVGAWWLRHLSWVVSLPKSGGAEWFRPTWRRVAAGLLILLMLLHFTGFALEIIWRPLYPWDAWMNWAPKARVWLEHGSLVPFVAAEEWLASQNPDVYTLGAWHYPPLVPLMQLWMALALGQWNESLINLPWLFCGLALALACYGQLRALGASRLFALILTYLLVSLPFLGTHIALAGYAELWMASFYALAVMAFARWAMQRDVRQGVLALVFVLALPSVKQPGIIWAATFLPAVLVALIPGRQMVLVALFSAVVLVTLYFTTGIHLTLPRIGEILISVQEVRLPGYAGSGLKYFPVWGALGDNGFLLANWHLFWYGAPLSLLMTLPVAWRNRRLRSLLTLVASGLAFLFFIFFFNRQYSLWAQDYTTLNRAFLHLVPAMLFIQGALVLGMLEYRQRRFSSEGEGPDAKPGSGGQGHHSA